MELDDDYNENYYSTNNQGKDRPALLWYARLIRKNFTKGPIFEFGAGVGHLCKRLSIPNYAFEINEFARKSIKQNSDRTKILEETDFGEYQEYFVGIVALHVFEHLTDLQVGETIELFEKMLKTGGQVLISTPALNGFAHKMQGQDWIAFEDKTHINIKNSQEWIELFQAKGFKLNKGFSDGFYDFPYKTAFFGRNLWLLLTTALNLLSANPILDINKGENNIFIFEKEHIK